MLQKRGKNMSNDGLEKAGNPSRIFYLSEIIGAKIILNGSRIGKLSDMIIVEKGMPLPHITHLCVVRPSGKHPLIIPIDKILSMTAGAIAIAIDIESIADYESILDNEAMLINDYVLNKKVIDLEKREVSMVYDVKILRVNKNMYVTDVDFSKYGLFRRFGMKWLADFLKIKENTLSWPSVQPLPPDISNFHDNFNPVNEKLSDIPPVDLANILEKLNHEQREIFFQELDSRSAAETFAELDPGIQQEVVSSMNQPLIARLIKEMTPGQAAAVLALLGNSEKDELLKVVEPALRTKIQSILGQQEQSITNYCTSEILKFHPAKSVDDIRDNFKDVARNKDFITYIYVVDSRDILEGVLDLKELLTAEDGVKLKDIMSASVVSLTQESTMKDAGEMFNRYGLSAIPVTDSSNKLIGVLPYKDVVKLQRRFLD